MKYKTRIICIIMIISMILVSCGLNKDKIVGDYINSIGWVYEKDGNVYLLNDGIYCINEKNKKLISDDIKAKFYLGEKCIYYIDYSSNFIRYNIQNNLKEIILKDCQQALAYTDYIFYVDKSNNMLCRINLDGSGKIELYKLHNVTLILSAFKDYVYICDTVPETLGKGDKYYRINTKTGDAVQIAPFGKIIGFKDGWIYYISLEIKLTKEATLFYDYKLKKFKEDGTGDQDIITFKPQNMEMCLVNEWLLFINPEDNKLYKMHEDGSDIQTFTDLASLSVIQNNGNFVYVKNRNNEIYRIDNSGIYNKLI